MYWWNTLRVGLITFRKAFDHSFMTIDALKKNDSISVVENVRYVQDGKILTTGGITSGIDGALHIVESFNGKKIADITYYNRENNLDFMK